MAELSESARKAREALAKKTPAAKTLSPSDFLSTGVTPLNLAMTGRATHGFQKGKIYRVIGKSQTAKTMVAMQVLCEASLNPAFKDYDLVYDDVERGMNMDVAAFWPPLVGRIQPPAKEKDGTSVYSRVMTDFYKRFRERMDKGRSVVWVEDSLDSLSHEIVKVDENTGKTKTVEADTKMGDGKAKANAQEMRKLINGIEKTGSILILVQHAKANIGSFFSEFVTTGGLSPEYYSTLDIWLGSRGLIKRKYKTKELPVGKMIEAHVKKNRIQGRDRVVQFPLYNDYGIDDIGACIKYLIEYEHWDKTDGRIAASEFNFTGYERDLVKKIEAEKLHTELRQLCKNLWAKVEAALSDKRPPKYGG